jgi:hypothetical protein
MTPGAELGRATVLLNRYKSVHLHLIRASPNDSRTGLRYSWFSGPPTRPKSNSSESRAKASWSSNVKIRLPRGASVIHCFPRFYSAPLARSSAGTL